MRGALGASHWLTPRLLFLLMLLLAPSVAGGSQKGEGPPPPPPPLDFPEDPQLPTAGVGYLPGSGSVGPTGDANYDIPIVVPPGRAGVQPSLSLRYSSRAGNGELGVGWGLAGTSEIRRCRSNLSTEGLVDGIDFDLTDALCLDGQKLVRVGLAPEGSEYRTEHDSFARILSNGGGAAIPSYPDSFDVYAKSGRIYHYAAQEAPRTAVDPVTGEAQPAGSATAVWLLTEERDRSGNTISYEYGVLPASGALSDFEYLLSRIVYTGHTSGAEPERQVVFEYEQRPDVSFAYESGVRFSQRHRLRKMRMFAPDPQESREVWSYTLSYIDSPSTQRSLLQSATRCEAGGACLWSKQFHYDMTPGVELEPTVISDEIAPEVLQGTHDTRFVVGDFDGNGKDDLLYRKAPDLVKLRRSLAGMLDTKTTTSFENLSHMELTDHNGDGATDVVGMDRAQGWRGFRLFLWDAATAAFQTSGPLIPKEDITDEYHDDTTYRVELADMDGDARLDLLSFFQPTGGDVENWKLFLSDGIWFGAPADTGVWGWCSIATGTISTDLDADGRADFLAGDSPCGAMQALTLDESGILVPKPAWGISATWGQEMVLADLNGDGLKDGVYLAGSGQGASVRHACGVESRSVPGGARGYLSTHVPHLRRAAGRRARARVSRVREGRGSRPRPAQRDDSSLRPGDEGGEPVVSRRALPLCGARLRDHGGGRHLRRARGRHRGSGASHGDCTRRADEPVLRPALGEWGPDLHGSAAAVEVG